MGEGGVFPAYAGMFLSRIAAWRVSMGFPRVCGDVPLKRYTPLSSMKFSPRMRGCSAITLLIVPKDQVFPAYAGMFLAENPAHELWRRFPRVCGDVPVTNNPNFDRNKVFPAYAGMFR